MRCARVLGLPQGPWRAHSLRRGGAAALAEAGVGPDAAKVFGRWGDERSCRLYTRPGARAFCVAPRASVG
eukprot:4692868-Lingulodinium_polyedra.AAC.1